MTKQPPAALAAAIARDQTAGPTEDKLEKVRDAVRAYRDRQREAADLDERLKKLNAELFEMRMKQLPDLFTEVGVDTLGLPAEGNLPAYDAEMKPYYHASISAEWEPERQAAAFAHLDKVAPDLIRSTYTIFIGKDDRKTALKVEAALEKLKVPYETRLAVPWNTLTAWIREQIEKHKRTPPLDLLGATVGSVVNLKQRKNPT